VGEIVTISCAKGKALAVGVVGAAAAMVRYCSPRAETWTRRQAGSASRNSFP
jgi:hypothetical protein